MGDILKSKSFLDRIPTTEMVLWEIVASVIYGIVAVTIWQSEITQAVQRCNTEFTSLYIEDVDYVGYELCRAAATGNPQTLGALAVCGLLVNGWAILAIYRAAGALGLNQRNYLIGALFSPLITRLVMQSAKNPSPDLKAIGVTSSPDGYLAKCPGCAEHIKLDAVVCRFCSTKVATEFKMIKQQLPD